MRTSQKKDRARAGVEETLVVTNTQLEVQRRGSKFCRLAACSQRHSISMASSTDQEVWTETTGASTVGLNAAAETAESEQVSGSAMEGVDPAEVLPAEVMVHVLAYLSAEDMARAARVSKRWKVAASDNYLWLRLFEQRFPFAAPELKRRFRESGAVDWRSEFRNTVAAEADALHKMCTELQEPGLAHSHRLRGARLKAGRVDARKPRKTSATAAAKFSFSGFTSPSARSSGAAQPAGERPGTNRPRGLFGSSNPQRPRTHCIGLNALTPAYLPENVLAADMAMPRGNVSERVEQALEGKAWFRAFAPRRSARAPAGANGAPLRTPPDPHLIAEFNALKERVERRSTPLPDKDKHHLQPTSLAEYESAVIFFKDLIAPRCPAYGAYATQALPPVDLARGFATLSFAPPASGQAWSVSKGVGAGESKAPGDQDDADGGDAGA